MNSILSSNCQMAFKADSASKTYSMWDQHKHKIKEDAGTAAGIVALGTPLATVTPLTILMTEQTDMSRAAKDVIQISTTPFSLGGFASAGAALIILAMLGIKALRYKSSDILNKIIKK